MTPLPPEVLNEIKEMAMDYSYKCWKENGVWLPLSVYAEFAKSVLSNQFILDKMGVLKKEDADSFAIRFGAWILSDEAVALREPRIGGFDLLQEYKLTIKPK
jgi:hypothetical protein